MRTTILIVMFCMGSLFSCKNTSEKKESLAVSNQEIVDSYVYLLSRALVVRQEQMDFEGTGIEYNSIKYNAAGKADFVNPNLDVAYMEAWIAIDTNSATIIEIPEINDRYYTVQLLDGWGEVAVNINDRNFPDHPYGKFAICLKGSHPDIPDDAFRIDVENKKLKMLARVELQDDIETAVALQQQFKVSAIGNPNIAPTINFPKFTNKQLPGHQLFNYTDAFLKTPDTKMKDTETIQNQVRNVADYVSQSDANASKVDSIIKTDALPKFINFATTKAGAFKNGWLATLKAGNYYGDYWTRTSANFVGIWANTSEEVIYFIASKDANGNALGEGTSYTLQFSPEQLPIKNVNGFWSVILVDFPNYRVVENDLNRYNFSNYSEFNYEEDGSLVLYVAPEYNPEWPKTNWLPSPQTGAFNLTLRMYIPKQNVLEGEWFPAPIQPIR